MIVTLPIPVLSGKDIGIREPHGIGWHLIGSGIVKEETDDYEHGIRYWAEYKSTGGTCYDEENGKSCWRPEKHIWFCTYVYYADTGWVCGVN